MKNRWAILWALSFEIDHLPPSAWIFPLRRWLAFSECLSQQYLLWFCSGRLILDVETGDYRRFWPALIVHPGKAILQVRIQLETSLVKSLIWYSSSYLSDELRYSAIGALQGVLETNIDSQVAGPDQEARKTRKLSNHGNILTNSSSRKKCVHSMLINVSEYWLAMVLNQNILSRFEIHQKWWWLLGSKRSFRMRCYWGSDLQW